MTLAETNSLAASWRKLNYCALICSFFAQQPWRICRDKVVSQNLLVNGQTSSHLNLADAISEKIIKKIDKNVVSHIVKVFILTN